MRRLIVGPCLAALVATGCCPAWDARPAVHVIDREIAKVQDAAFDRKLAQLKSARELAELDDEIWDACSVRDLTPDEALYVARLRRLQTMILNEGHHAER